MESEEKKTRAQQAEETKRHIFNVALNLLDECDFEKIKIRDIVNAADVSIGTFYHYYKSKLEVYYETYQLADEYFEETVTQALTQPSAKERIFCFFDYYARYSSEITSLKLTKLLYNSSNKSFDRQVPKGMKPLLKELLTQAIESGELYSDDSVDEMVEFLIIAVRGQVYHWCTNDGAYDLRQTLKRFVERLLKVYTS